MPLDGLVPGGTDIWVPGLLILAGILGIVVPVVPGLLIAVGAVLLWSWQTSTTLSWTIFAIVAVLYAAGLVAQYLVPGKRLKAQGVGTGTILAGVLLGIIGFFVIPVVGAPIGFVLGIFLVEQSRSRDRATAWLRTKQALRAVLTSIGIELIAGMLIALTWVIGVLLSR